jgi:hypothetical protein
MYYLYYLLTKTSEPETFNDDETVEFFHVKLYELMSYMPELLTFILKNMSRSESNLNYII